MAFDAYEGFNQHTLVIKGWAVAISLATMLTAFHPDLKSFRRLILVVSVLTASLFWITDAVWKGYQSAYLRLLTYYEGLDTQGSGIAGASRAEFLNPIEGWKTYHDKWEWLANMFITSALLPYLPIVVLGLVLIFVAPGRAKKDLQSPLVSEAED
ncbi:MAG: hypothetical protein AAGC81_16990 [Pseudomonadota bacterium]